MKGQSENKKKFDVCVLIKIIKDTIQGLDDDNVTKLTTSLAYVWKPNEQL